MQVVGGADYAHPRSLDDAPLLANQVVENFEVIPNVSDSNSEKFCGFIIVNGFSYPFVTGRYNMCDEKSSGASEELVYKHELRDSYIFYDPDYGWKLGNQDSLEEHDYWLKSKNKVPNYSHHSIKRTKGSFNNYVDKMREGGREGGGLEMSVFVHAQGIKNVHAGGWGCQKMAKFCPRSC